MHQLTILLLLLISPAIARATAGPGLVILSPVKGQILPGHELTARFLTPNFTIPKEGHIHLWLDQTKFTKTSAIKAYTTSHSLTNLKYGYRTLTAELVKPDHSSFVPPITTSVTFKLDSASMSPRPAPSSNSSLLYLLLTLLILLAAAFYLVSKQRVKPKSKKH